jgi:hypothetical protein
MKHIKHLIALGAISLFIADVSGAILVVNNSNANPGQYYYLQTAIDSAEAGDTLMLQPSTNTYGDVVLNKSLTLIGIGHKPVKDMPLIAAIGYLTLGQYTSGVTVIGIKVNYFQTPCNSYGNWSYNNDITIRNCHLVYFGTNNPNNCYGFNSMSNILIENCFLGGINLPGTGNNALVQNNVFNGYTLGFGVGLTNVVIKNNLFMYETAINQLSGANAVFENNIFFRTSPANSYNQLYNCVFNNNLTYQTTNDTIIGGTNTGNNNIVGQDPLFVELNFNASPLYQPELYNYRLQELSPGHNAGTDGQDIGPYGNNMTYSETGENVNQPVIREMNLDNSTVPSSGTITVHVKATPSKND